MTYDERWNQFFYLVKSFWLELSRYLYFVDITLCIVLSMPNPRAESLLSRYSTLYTDEKRTDERIGWA